MLSVGYVWDVGYICRFVDRMLLLYNSVKFMIHCPMLQAGCV